MICTQCRDVIPDDEATTVTIQKPEFEPVARPLCPACAARFTVAWYSLRLTWR